jgi:hypothetical protein
MYKRRSDKKMTLSRETLRRLASDRLEGVAGGLTAYTCNGTCPAHTCITCAGNGSICASNCHTCPHHTC